MLSRRSVGILFALVIGPMLLPAQTAATKAGPFNGSWGGVVNGGAADGTPATMQLAIAANGTMMGKITGPKIQAGTVRGTHDAKTGAVKFDVSLEGNSDKFAFIGAITKDTLKATTTDQQGRVFTMRLVKGMKAPQLASGGPQNPADPTRAAVQRTFTEVSGWVTRAAAMVPAEKYSYKPVGTVRSFGEIVAHVADAYTYYCTRALGKEVEWSDAIEKGTKDKAAIEAKLKVAQDVCAAANGRGQLGALVDNVAHTNLHYGNMITYLRMMGLTPPSS